jgi:hypothetical protein
MRRMKITKLDVYILRAPDTGRPHWVSHFFVPRANDETNGVSVTFP